MYILAIFYHMDKNIKTKDNILTSIKQVFKRVLNKYLNKYLNECFNKCFNEYL